MSIFLDQADFMTLGGQGVDHLNKKQAHLYATFILDETKEFEDAHWGFVGHEEEIKEAVDVIVVAAGFLITLLGVEGAQKAWNAVHESNLAKVSGGGVEKREDGKILKNAEYKKIAKAKMMAELEKLLV